ncbi:GCN5-related N-acetyltransferase 1, chloroplastic [Primulina tabacum]|uniref:GCN5-related N-acetyltransferase 1, chloroplastic n=1 Tax=Primulina tabacum TaxID=48773 RepID=UPI003F5A9EEB
MATHKPQIRIYITIQHQFPHSPLPFILQNNKIIRQEMLLHSPIPFNPPLGKPTRPHQRHVAVSATSTFSISDESLSSRGFTFHRTIDNLNLDCLNTVFAAVGFPRRDVEKIRVALEHTDAVLWVEYEKTRKPVAFARATGDGVFNAIIWDVVVDPSFQGIGLGKAVMERLVTELAEKGISNIALYSEPRVMGFYRPLGFVADPDGIRGMVYSRKSKKI